jgi:hypothetical protein
MMCVTSIGFFVKEREKKREGKKRGKKMQEIWFVGFILAEGKREKTVQKIFVCVCECGMAVISCYVGYEQRNFAIFFHWLGYCVAVIGQSKKIKTLTLQLVVAVPLGMPG